jgi:hypothetical protein
VDEVNVAVIAPILGRDLSFVSDVDPRVRAFDASFAAPGHRDGPRGPAEADSDLLAAVLAQAEVLLVGYPVLDVYAGELAGQPPRPELTGLPLVSNHLGGTEMTVIRVLQIACVVLMLATGVI